jgi:hypothetical protein
MSQFKSLPTILPELLLMKTAKPRLCVMVIIEARAEERCCNVHVNYHRKIRKHYYAYREHVIA